MAHLKQSRPQSIKRSLVTQIRLRSKRFQLLDDVILDVIANLEESGAEAPMAV
jgi:hypothetical protein